MPSSSLFENFVVVVFFERFEILIVNAIAMVKQRQSDVSEIQFYFITQEVVVAITERFRFYVDDVEVTFVAVCA